MQGSGIEEIAKQIAQPGKGILAADEFNETMTNRFASIGVESTPQTRRDFREILFRSEEAMTNYISGVILYEETLTQCARDGTPFLDILKRYDVVPGVKVDLGPYPLPLMKGEFITKGQDNIKERIAKYAKNGARFGKWRAVLRIGACRPSDHCIASNTVAMAIYAAACQEVGIVPIVEPEVQMDDPECTTDIETNARILREIMVRQFEQLDAANVRLEGIVLKPGMVMAGNGAAVQSSSRQIAEKTAEVLQETVPDNVPGVMFLSGGQSEQEATERLSLINQTGDFPYPVSFSYGRALQTSAIAAWNGKPQNVAQASKVFTHRAKMNSLAARGQWNAAMEAEYA